MSINCDSSLWCIGKEAECGHSFNRLPSLTFHLRLADASIRCDCHWVRQLNKLRIVWLLGLQANNGKAWKDESRSGAMTPISLMAGRVYVKRSWKYEEHHHSRQLHVISKGTKFASSDCLKVCEGKIHRRIKNKVQVYCLVIELLLFSVCMKRQITEFISLFISLKILSETFLNFLDGWKLGWTVWKERYRSLVWSINTEYI